MISVADLQLYVGALEDGTDSETILETLEEEAVAIVERATGRYFGVSGSVTWLLRGDGGIALWLPDTVTAVASVSTRATLADSFVALTVTDDYFRDGMKLFRVGAEWPDGEALVQVVATRGYAANEEPPQIRLLVKDLVNFAYRVGRKSFLEPGGSADYTKVTGWAQTIAAYRAPLYG